MMYILQTEASTLIFALISCIIAIIGSVLGVITYFSNKRDKAVKEAKETNMELINYRLDELDKNVQKILDKLDNYDDDIRKIAREEINKHILEYHK